MNRTRQFTVPVIGMTCLGCAGSVEASSKQAEAVTDAEVNFASERLTFSVDATHPQANQTLVEVRQLVKRAGYKIPTLTLTLPILGMSCTACSNAVEQAIREVDGVVYANVNFAAEQAQVEYVSGLGSRAPIVEAVRRAGYDTVSAASPSPDVPPVVSEAGLAEEGEFPPAPVRDDVAVEPVEDAEAAARAAAVRHQVVRLLVGAVFSLPLVAISMGRDIGLWGAVGARRLGELAAIGSWQLRCSSSWAGDYYVGAIKSLRESQRQYGRSGGNGYDCCRTYLAWRCWPRSLWGAACLAGTSISRPRRSLLR